MMKYFRYYPWGLQLLLFALMVFTMLWFGLAMIGMLMPVFTGIDITQLKDITEQSPRPVVQAMLLLQGLSNLFMFLIPAALFAYLAHPQPGGYLGLRKPGKYMQLLLAILIMAGVAPFLSTIEHWLSYINFGEDARKSQESSNAIFSAFLTMPDTATFIKTFIILAIMPGFGEELFFRGILLRFAKKRSRSMVMPILFSAAVFSYAHANAYGYLSIFLAGALLATIYYITGSLWCSIAAHTFFNGSQVILAYMGNSNAAIKAFLSADSVPYGIVIGGLVISGVAFYVLYKGRTPLADGWEQDFAVAEGE